MDSKYLFQLQKKFADCKGSFCGYGVAVDNFKNPIIDFNYNDTYIQKQAINHDYGLFKNLDEFFKEKQQHLNCIKRFFYRHLGRKAMNKNIAIIRENMKE